MNPRTRNQQVVALGQRLALDAIIADVEAVNGNVVKSFGDAVSNDDVLQFSENCPLRSHRPLNLRSYTDSRLPRSVPVPAIP